MKVKRKIIIQGNRNDVNKEMKDVVSTKPIERLSEASQKRSEACTELNCRQYLMKEKIATSKEIVTLEMINRNPQKYYGVNVNYECENNETRWKLFYSDFRIYLIASDYIPSKYAAYGIYGRKIYVNDEYCLSFNNVIEDYKRLEDIMMRCSSHRWVQDNIEPQIAHLRYAEDIVANTAAYYMLDAKAWSKFVNSRYAEYAIGGPTIEMLIESYNKKNDKNHICYSQLGVGYEASDENGKDTIDYYLPRVNDELYMIESTKKAYGYWLSNANPRVFRENELGTVGYDGFIQFVDLKKTSIGLRPLVCLNSDVRLSKLSDGTYELVL